MRSILLAFIILLITYIVKTDLSEGTLSHASFYENNNQTECLEKLKISSVSVEIQSGDTLQSLFALHPSSTDMTFLERLAIFYQVNPHLRKQALLPGTIVNLPITQPTDSECVRDELQ